MTKVQHNLSNQKRRTQRVHARVIATAERPKLVINRSNKYLYLQVVDEAGHVVAAQSDLRLLKKGTLKRNLTKTERAGATGKQLAADLRKSKIAAVSVDRGACKFHGRIKAAVEQIRENGIEA